MRALSLCLLLQISANVVSASPVNSRAACRNSRLKSVSVVLHFVESAHALGQAITQGRLTGWDEGRTQHGPSLSVDVIIIASGVLVELAKELVEVGIA
jgi:hypothetical protein